jgi:ribosomal protein S18 acetylase RimI-like enzyme
MREITDVAELRETCADDQLCVWAAQDLGTTRAWVSDDGRAVAVAAPDLSRWDRVALWGAPDAAAPLAMEVLDLVGPAFRPFGAPALIDAVIGAEPALESVATFGWMGTTRAEHPGGWSRDGAQWLPSSADAEVAAFVDDVSPTSYALPGMPAVERWAGVRDDHGDLLAVGALAWSAPSIGFLAGIMVDPAVRGRGLGRRVCELLLDESLRERGSAALMVDAQNVAAIRLYQGLGLTYRDVRVAAIVGSPQGGPDESVRPAGAVVPARRRVLSASGSSGR